MAFGFYIELEHNIKAEKQSQLLPFCKKYRPLEKMGVRGSNLILLFGKDCFLTLKIKKKLNLKIKKKLKNFKNRNHLM